MRFFFFFVKARFCIRIVCISIIIAYFVMYSKSGKLLYIVCLIILSIIIFMFTASVYI